MDEGNRLGKEKGRNRVSEGPVWGGGNHDNDGNLQQIGVVSEGQPQRETETEVGEATTITAACDSLHWGYRAWGSWLFSLCRKPSGATGTSTQPQNFKSKFFPVYRK